MARIVLCMWLIIEMARRKMTMFLNDQQERTPKP
jgi:hypothetical protein